jgi:hypothetical protein
MTSLIFIRSLWELWFENVRKLAQGRGLPDALVTDNDALCPRGRPSLDESERKEVGEIFRVELARILFNNNMTRLVGDNTTRNAYGHVYTS